MPTPQKKIFISHASKNKNYGEKLVDLLREIGLKENEIIFTSNPAYGIPVGQNIFSWLKSQITEKPFVIYLLSEEYYKSVACLNEMGAAWIIENKHAAIFTPNFDLSSKEFRSGALDPNEIGFRLNDKDRLLSFIEMLKVDFDISNHHVIISQSVDKYIKAVGTIDSQSIDVNSLSENKVQGKREDSFLSHGTTSVFSNSGVPIEKRTIIEPSINEPSTSSKNTKYSEFVNWMRSNKAQQGEIILLQYLLSRNSVKLRTGWQESNEIDDIIEWEKINDIENILSKNYSSTLNRWNIKGFIEPSELTSHGNVKEYILKEDIIQNFFDLPQDLLIIIEKTISKVYFEYNTEMEDETDDLPF